MSAQNNADNESEVASSEEALVGSSRRDNTDLTVGVLLVASPFVILPVVDIALALINVATGLSMGLMRFLVDLAAVLALLAGVWKIIAAARRLRIRRRRAGPAALWKEALRAEDERDFREAVRLYGELVRLHPSTTWADDAKSSIELLRKEGKIDWHDRPGNQSLPPLG